MSEAPKIVEETVVAPTTVTPLAEPTPEVKATEEPVTELSATTEPAVATGETAAPVKDEIKPVEEGVLGYKGPGLLKSFIFQKKFFWFGSEAVETKHLSSYLRGEKPEVANHNAAWASHTGEGLLLFAKKPTEKASPAGVINLSEVSDITNDGPVAFHFTIAGHKHTFEASTVADRDNWVSVLKTKVAEAKELAPTVKEHETYKKSHSTLSKPFATAAATPKKSTEVKKEDKAETKEEKKEEKAEAKEEDKEEKKDEKKEIKERKSRSASRKRTSIFGSIPGFGKKEEKVEAKEETPVVAPAAEAVDAPAVAEPAPVATPAVTEPVVPATEETAAPVEAKPAPTKRNSIFGTLKSQFSQTKEKTEKKSEDAPVVPAKDAEPVSETAPVIPAVESTEPLATSVASPATVPVETTPVVNGESSKVEAPVVKNEKRKSSLPWLNNKKEKATTSDEESEKPKSPFAKLRATVKGKTSPKAEKAEVKEEKKDEKTETATPALETKSEEPIVSEPTPVVSATTPQVSATA